MYRSKQAKLFSWLFVLIILGFICTAVTAFASTENNVVRVGYMLLDNFEEQQEIVQGDKTSVVRSGYGYEYLQMIRGYTGWEYEYVIGSWQDLVDKLEKGEIDLLSHVARTPERENTMYFSTEPQGRETHYLYVDGPSDAVDPNDYTTINGKNIGVIRGDFRTIFFKEWLKEHGITCNIIEYTDIWEIHTALHSGKIHATSAGSLSVAACPEAKWRALIRFDDTTSYFAVTKNEKGERLIAEINEAHDRILSINENFGLDLQQKYANKYTKDAPTLSETEKLWIKKRGTLKVGYCENRRPLAYTDETGSLMGLLKEYLDAISKQYGIGFETISYKTGNELLRALQEKEVDIISPVGYNYGMAEIYGLAITNPITIETMVAVYKGYKGTDPKDIFEKIAILDNSITEKDYAKRFYPDSKWVKASTIEDAVNLVADDKAGCYIIRSSTWSWYKNEYPRLNDLQVLTLSNSNAVNMAIRNEDIALLPILNDGISLLSQADINQYIVAYSDARAEMTLFTLMKDHPITTAIGILAFILFIGLVFVLYRFGSEKKYLAKLEKANREAEVAKDEAEKASMAKSTFLTSMSHDIRTPMNAIVGMTTLARKHINDTDYVKNCLSKVTLASDHLLTLINDVLDINKIESGKLSLNPTVFSLADAIMNLANIGRHQINEKNHRFEIRVHNITQEYLFADELRINQIFINLLSNAVKYTPAGGYITVDVKQQAVAGEKGKIRLIFEIKDTGIGMSKEFQAKMYELFAMANRNNGKTIGSGVGLAICKQLVELMEGEITCESEVDKGTKFKVALELPVADKVAEQFMLPEMRILLVDDDDIFLDTASETLKEIGLIPDTVNSGEKAVAIVREKNKSGEDYPLIIIDWRMPEMDGIETTKQIRKIVGEEVSIIIISAYAPEDVRDMAIKAGADGFITKPFFKSIAYQSIGEVLGITEDKPESITDTHKKVAGMNVLVAEDNDLNWEIACELLNMYGVSSKRAENGKQCIKILEMAKPNEYDAVLMDIQMPVMNGYDAARAIRENEKDYIKTIPIVAMTADAYTEDVIKCAQAGMNAHVAKPIDMERLLEVLSSLCS